MFPPDFFGPRTPGQPDLHKLLDEKRPLRRGQSRDPAAHDPEPFVRFDAYLTPRSGGERATLIELAKDPRFSDRVVMSQRQGVLVLLGRALMWAGWQLIRRSAGNNGVSRKT